ncbi:hypothetical protein D3C78_1974820 [compost metagenome]
MLQQSADFIDQMRGQNNRARMIRVILDQMIIEQLSGHGVQSKIRFIKDRYGRAAGESDDDAY